MTTIELHEKLADSCLTLLKNLSIEAQLLLIQKLKFNIDSSSATPIYDVSYFAGAWEDETTAEELIATLRESRTFNRQIIDF